jgi:uncharacterized protein (TIGR02246 family)
MKLLAIFLLLFAHLAQAQTPKRPAATQEEDAVRATIDACIGSWNRHDYKDLDTYTTPDVNWVTNVGMWWQGREAVRYALQTYHTGMYRNTELRSEQLTVRFATPTTALVHQVVYIGHYFPPDGVDHEYNRQGNGQMMITYTVVKPQAKWLIAAAQVTDINLAASAFNPVK